MRTWARIGGALSREGGEVGVGTYLPTACGGTVPPFTFPGGAGGAMRMKALNLFEELPLVP